MDASKLSEFIMHHVMDGSEWHPIPFLPGIHLPHLEIAGMDMSVSLHVLMLFIAAGFMFLFFGILYKKDGNKAPKGFTNFLEVLVLFVRDEVVYPYLGNKDGRRLLPFFLNFFFLILILNLMGQVPAFVTATGNVSLTAGLATITLSLMIIGGFIKNGPIGFIKIFLPGGVPLPILFILFPIEIMGAVIKPFALTIRLFANMLCGHIILFSLLGLIAMFGWIATPAVLLALFIAILELLVAFIQAYVFTMLSAIFVGGFLHPEH